MVRSPGLIVYTVCGATGGAGGGGGVVGVVGSGTVLGIGTEGAAGEDVDSRALMRWSEYAVYSVLPQIASSAKVLIKDWKVDGGEVKVIGTSGKNCSHVSENTYNRQLRR